jgi:transposase
MKQDSSRTGALESATVIGLDLGDRHSVFVAMDASGEVVATGKVGSTRRQMERFFADRPAWRIALEVGTHSPWVSRLLEELGHEVIVANPRQVSLIFRSKRKTDRVDAEQLARLARMDPRMLHPVQHRGPQAQVGLAVLRSRSLMVASRTQLINHVRSSVKSAGHRLPSCSADAFSSKAPESIPEELRAALAPVVEQIASLTSSIKAYDVEVERLIQEDFPQAQRLRQVNGVGPVTSLAFVLTIDDPDRFLDSRDVAAYLGLVPGNHQSGDRDPQMHITKTGDMLVRRLLVQAAQYVMGPFGTDCDLRRWGLALASRGGKAQKKRAIVAVARKLSVLLHALWCNGEVYEPLRQAQRRAAAA